MAKDKKAATAESTPAKVIHQSLTIQQARIEPADISTWTSAVNSFKVGNREKYYNLCENLMSDGVLANAIDKLVENVTGEDLVFQVDGKNVDLIDELIDSPEFEYLLKEITLSKVYGRSVIELSFTPEFSAFSWPRKHCYIKNIDKEFAIREKFVTKKQGDTNGYDYTQDEFFFEVGDDYDLGLIYRAAQYVIYKRGNFGDWAQFAEIFGMPFVMGKYNSTDVQARDQLFEALGQIGGKPVAAVPKETDIEVVWGSGTGSTDLYKTLKDACNEEILIAIQGETMTTVSGSSLSQSEVHQDTSDKQANALRRYVQRMLNKHLIPALEKRGFPVSGGKFVFPREEAPISVADIKALSELIDIPADFVHNKFGIPMANDGEKLAKVAAVQMPFMAPRKEDEEKEKEKEKEKEAKLSDVPPSGGWGAFMEGLSNFFAVARTPRSRADLNLADKSTSYTAATNIDKLFEKAIKEIYKQYGLTPEDMPVVNKSLFDISNKILQKGIDSSFSVDFGKTDPEFINQFKTNAAVFSAFKAHAQGNDIVAQLVDAEGNLKSYHEFKKSVLGSSIKADYNQNWLKTEYNMAVRSARVAEKLKGYEAVKHLYPNLKFMPSTAAEPREAHKEFYGVILPIEHPWWNDHTPPLDWGCECSVENTDEDVTATPEGGEEPDPLFAINPAKEANFVNIDMHPYKSSLDLEAQKNILKLVQNLTKEAKK